MPNAGIATTVSVHGTDVADANGDGRDEVYMASLLGAIWVVTAPGDASAITTADIHLLNNDPEQWLEASIGHSNSGGTDFVVAASNASKAVDFEYIGGSGGDVTDPANYQKITLVDSLDIEGLVPGGIRVYGLDVGDDMDGDGKAEIIFSRGSTRGGQTAPALFLAEEPGSTGITDNQTVPQSFELFQNFPNPFNPETQIKFGLPTASRVTLTIYNVLGQKVRTLVNGFLEAKVHTVRWDGRNDRGMQVPSGMYFYRLKAKGFIKTNRMLLIR